jgi:hypothetical protein
MTIGGASFRHRGRDYEMSIARAGSAVNWVETPGIPRVWRGDTDLLCGPIPGARVSRPAVARAATGQAT